MEDSVCAKCGGIIDEIRISSSRDFCSRDFEDGVLCTKCILEKLYEMIHPKLLDLSRVLLLDISIDGYKNTIIDENYILMRINSRIMENFRKIISVTVGESNVSWQYSQKEKYIFAHKFHKLNWERIEYHLHNRFSNSLHKSNLRLFEWNIPNNQFVDQRPVSENVLNINLSGITDMIELMERTHFSPNESDPDVTFIRKEITQLGNTGHLLRGINTHYSENDGISSSIYRKFRKFCDAKMLQEHENTIVKKLLSMDYYKNFLKKTSPKSYNTGDEIISALTDFRHSGIETCLLDFTKDSKIALYFSCYDGYGRPGEIIAIPNNILETLHSFKYPIQGDWRVKPKPLHTKSRVDAQSSVFIYCGIGFLCRDKYKNIFKNLLVDPNIKKCLLKSCKRAEEDIYPDFHGFINNPNNFLTATKHFDNANNLILEAESNENNNYNDDDKKLIYHHALLELREFREKSSRKNEIYLVYKELVKECNKRIKELERGRSPSKCR